MWQDYAFTTAAILFGYSLVPQILKNRKNKDASQIAWQFAIISVIAITVTGSACYSLGMYISSSCNLLQLVAWFVIINQKLRYKEQKLS